MTQIKAFIFDIDGVLVESKTANFISFNLALNSIFGLSISEQEDNVLDSLSSKDKLKLILSGEGITATEEQIKCFSALKYEYLLHHIHLLDYNPSARSVCELLKQRDIKIGLVTNARAEYVKLVASEMGIEFYLDCAINNSYGLKTKPAPDMYHEAHSQLCINRHESIIFEDSHVGLTAARLASDNVIEIKSVGQITVKYIQNILDQYGVNDVRIP